MSLLRQFDRMFDEMWNDPWLGSYSSPGNYDRPLALESGGAPAKSGRHRHGRGSDSNALSAYMSPLTSSAAQCDLVEVCTRPPAPARCRRPPDPPCPTVQRPDCWELTANIPGFRKEDVNVDVYHGVLRVSAEKHDAKEDSGEREGWKYHRVERTAGALHRQFKLPPSADQEHIEATAENGVLTINIPKLPAAPASEGKKAITVA